MLAAMAFGELLAKQGHGNVINIASMFSDHPITNTAASFVNGAAIPIDGGISGYWGI